ncbi:MAG: L-threonylcarbamoyladenylate synthase [Flavobacteriaceae bacterium]
MNLEKQLKKGKKALKKGKIILYPTDTVWGIGCDATNKKAVEKIYKLKKRDSSKSLIILVNGFDMLKDYVTTVPKETLEYLENQTVPTTVIYNTPNKIAKNAIALDGTIAIRIVSKGFANDLITFFGKPIVSTSANISKKPMPKCFDEISKKIIKKIDFIVPMDQQKSSPKSSKIIRFTNGNIEVLRD